MLHRDLLAFVFPPQCRLCRRPLSKVENQLCLVCLGSLPRTHFSQWHGNPLELNLSKTLGPKTVRSWLFFSDMNSARPLLHAIKYKGASDLAIYLAMEAAHEMQESRGHPPLFLPVPLHPAKLRKRGYNQSACLAQGLANVWGGELAPHALKRVRFTKTQTGMNKAQRWKNLSNAIVWQAEPWVEAHPGPWWLVDDVLTTGATLAACVSAIPEPFQKRVRCWTLACAFAT